MKTIVQVVMAWINLMTRHVSQALFQLRRWVTVMALVVAGCAMVQLLIFGFVHYTDIRFEKPAEQAATRDFSVIQTPKTQNTTNHAMLGKRKTITLNQLEAAQTTRVPSRWGGLMREASSIAVTLGVLSVIVLAVSAWMGVVVAGGASIVGVDRVVTAAVWSTVLMLACLPLSAALPATPLQGVFTNYSTLVAASQSTNDGQTSWAELLAMYLMIPAISGAVALFIMYWFRLGVMQGIMVQTMSEVDQRLEKEIADLHKQGVASHYSGRTAGVLNQSMNLAPTGTHGPATAGNANATGDQSSGSLPMHAPNPGNPIQRPI